MTILHAATSRVRDTATTLAIAAVGGFSLATLGAPAAWLSGAMLAVSAYALAGGRATMPVMLREVSFIALGITMGSGLTPEALAGIGRWPLSVALLFATLPLVVGLIAIFLVRTAGWPVRDALLGAMPGALSTVLAVAAAEGADVRRVATIQTFRLFAIVAFVPFAISGSSDNPVSRPNQVDADLLLVVGMVAASLAAGSLLRLINWPAPLLFAGFAVSGTLHASGLVASQLPFYISVPALVAIGANIGSRFAGTDWPTFKGLFVAGVGAVAIAVAVAAATASLCAMLVDLPIAQVFLAFAPGGVEAMIVLAYALGLDPAYVATHQLLRFLAIALLLPFVLRLMRPVIDNT